MAKRTPQANDAAPASPGRTKTARKGSRTAAAQSDTFAARTEPSAERPSDLGAPGITSSSTQSEPSQDEIRTRAYHRYLERGGAHGMDFEDWLEAERELKSGR